LKIWVCLVISCFELSFVFGVEMASPAKKLKCVQLKLTDCQWCLKQHKAQVRLLNIFYIEEFNYRNTPRM
jgi:DNA primase catalytic subunit